MSKKKFIKKFIIISISVVFLILILFFSFRNLVLHNILAKTASKIERDYDAKLSVNEAVFQGFSSIQLNEVSLKPNHADTLLYIKKVKTSVNMWKLIFKDVQIGNLEVENGLIQLIKKDSIKNFDRFLKKKITSENSLLSSSEKNYASSANRLVQKFLNLIPTSMDVKNIVVKLDDNGKNATINFKELTLKNKKLVTNVHVKTKTFTQNWIIEGTADPRENNADLSIHNAVKEPVKIPYFDERFNLKSSFDLINIKIDAIEFSKNQLVFLGSSMFKNFNFNHPKIASKDVSFEDVKVDFDITVGKDHISLNENTSVTFNKIQFQPRIELSTASDTVFKFDVQIPKMKAQDFIRSLPDGLFTNFQGMEAQGSFAYRLNFMFNLNDPDAIILESELDKDHFKITKYGEANLSKLNGEFVYRAFENGQYQRPILVGEANPNFTSLHEISPYLQKSVLTTEDPSFFHHKGFIVEAFKQSIVQNIKTKKFTRGGSTISMQLVKNVFLTREKTLSRKLEEILLVYILESNRIVSKERMLEVYFNVIEWGPNVYGIGEASQFYFQKKPLQLNLNESIYLATIVPRPKGFMWKFNSEGTLTPWAIQKQEFLTNIMLKRGVITPEDTIYKSLPVKVFGPAKNFMKITPKDTLDFQEEDFNL